MTQPGASATWMETVRPIALVALNSAALIGIAILLIFVLLPVALGAAGTQVPSAG